MIESATGVVLRTQRLTESSLIVRWLTAGSGRLSTAAKGARRPKSAFAGKLDLFVEADFMFSRSARSELHTLREVSVREFHGLLRADFHRLQVAAYGTALLEQATETDTPLPGLFDLFTGFLYQLSHGSARPRLIFAFELKLLDSLGLFPSLKQTRLKPATRELVLRLGREGWDTIQEIRPASAAVRELDVFLHSFLVEHLGRVPTSRGEALRPASA